MRKPGVKPSVRRWVAVLVAATVGGSVYLLVSEDSQRRPGIGALTKAIGQYRTIKPRLTGGFEHAPCVVEENSEQLVGGFVCRASEQPPPSISSRLARFAAATAEAGTTDRSPDARHTVGVWNVLWPNQPGSVELAISVLRGAADAAPASATIQNDLGAALLVRAEVDSNPQDLVGALAAIDSAIALDPSLVEARFNRALALEYLFLIGDASMAWEDYLAAAPAAAWATEGTRHLTRLNSELPQWDDGLRILQAAVINDDLSTVSMVVEQFPWKARTEILAALSAWSRAVQSGRPESADSLLGFARVTAAALEQLSGNALPLEAVDVIDRTLAARDSSRLAVLVAGQLALVEGEGYLNQFELVAADSRLADAVSLLTKAGSPLSGWADYRIASTHYQRADRASNNRALATLERIRRLVPARHVVLRAEAARTTGTIHEIRANYDLAVGAYDQAALDAQRARELPLLARARSSRARIQAGLRGARVTWVDLYGTLKLLPLIQDAFRARFFAFDLLAQQALRTAPALAERFQGQVVTVAGEMRREDSLAGAVAIAGAQTELGDILVQSGHVARALDVLSKAEREIESLPNERVRSALQGNLSRVMGRAQLEISALAARRALGRALDMYDQTDDSLALDRTFASLADAYLTLGHSDSAMAAFEAAMDVTERRRTSITELHLRAKFLDSARPVFDRLLALQLDQKEPARAFSFFESTRARVLWERIGTLSGEMPISTSSLTAAELRREIPEDAIVVSYAALEDQLVIWLASRDSLHVIREPLSASELRNLVSQLVLAIDDPELEFDDFSRLSGQLYGRLIGPFIREIDPRTRLVIVPDKWLHSVPFAALWDAEGRSFLIESREVTMAPSLSHYLWSLARSGNRVLQRLTRVLAIGNPAFDRRSFRLSYLPGAEVEASDVADTYDRSRSTVLIGADATRSAFLSVSTEFDVIHFAGHAVVRPEAPSMSHLVLASDSGLAGNGALYARDIFELDLQGTSLAVLSGCHTAGGELSSTEGPSSLARAFLAAGVPAVVASLWAVGDKETRDFFAAFHRRLSRHGDAASALRETQRDWIARARETGVAHWAAFQLFGATGAD